MNVYITVWDKDTNLPTFRQEDMIDEFEFYFNATGGSGSRSIDIYGVRKDPTRYARLYYIYILMNHIH